MRRRCFSNSRKVSSRNCRSCSLSVNSVTMCGRSRVARSNSVRARNHLENSCRAAWWRSDSPGISGSALRISEMSCTRSTSSPSGSRKTKSPNPRLSRMKLRKLFSSAGSALSRNSMPSLPATLRFSGSDDCSTTPASGLAFWTCVMNFFPALGSWFPSLGKPASLITPSRKGA